MKKNNNPCGWIYFLQNGDENFAKIGFTSESDPNARRKELQTGSLTELRFSPWQPIPGFYSQEQELHRLLNKFKAPFKGGKEWFDISSSEAKSVVESYRDLIQRNVDNGQLTLFSALLDASDLYKKYNLIPKWQIRQLEKPDPVWPDDSWVIETPRDSLFYAKSLDHADKTRLEQQYWSKYGRGNICWFPEDVAEYIRS